MTCWLSAGDDRSSLASWLALLSGLLLGLPSIYMMAANYGILPFTGRNMYLLGLNSLSDALETMVLLGMMAVCIGQVQSRNQGGGREQDSANPLTIVAAD